MLKVEVFIKLWCMEIGTGNDVCSWDVFKYLNGDVSWIENVNYLKFLYIVDY